MAAVGGSHRGVGGCRAVERMGLKKVYKEYSLWGFPGGAVVKNPPANAGDMGSSPGPGRSHVPWSN